ncbi:MAG TPA: MBL fold metallo-hydrolase [Candidatus Paceibacterota bacterium]|nr:MBL fold metallo-hydrolase [Candidatus Paceibacterota bacterium]
MIITYHDDNYFKLQSGNDIILVDPTDQRSFRGANIILNTKRPAEVEKPSKDDDVFWVSHAGEYEKGGIRIRGWQSSSSDIEKTIYRLDFDGFRFVIIGALEETPKEELQEFLTDVDIVVFPTKDGDMIKSSELAQFIRQMEPAFIIPSEGENLKSLLKEFNNEDVSSEEKITLRKSDISKGEMEIQPLKS